MPAPLPTAPYDPLTAEARELLFAPHPISIPMSRPSLKEPLPTLSTPMTDKPVKAANPTSPILLPLPRSLRFGTWMFKASAQALCTMYWKIRV